MPNVVALIPAGGVGVRLGRRTPKQFLALGRETIIGATVRRFTERPGMAAVVVAVPPDHVARARRRLRCLAPPPRLLVVPGGRTRQESVWRALQAAPADADVFVVHDAVRPFVTRTLIDRVVAAAAAHGAAVCGLPIVETVKRVSGDVVDATIERSGLWAVQTPQAFRAALLREAHEKALRDGVAATDDAVLVERLGHPVRVVSGLPENIKITTPEDLRRARRWARP